MHQRWPEIKCSPAPIVTAKMSAIAAFEGRVEWKPWGPQLIMNSVNYTTSFVKPIALSPDGQVLVFARPRPDSRSELVTSSPPGADPKPLPDFAPSPITPFSVRFSPDGHRLGVSLANELTILPFPRGKPHSIENIPHSSFNWMPDSRHIIYSRELSSPNEVV